MHPVLVQYIGSDIIAYSTFLFLGVLKHPIRQTTEETVIAVLEEFHIHASVIYCRGNGLNQPDLRDTEARYMRFNAQLIQNVA